MTDKDDPPLGDPPRPKFKSRVTIRKFDGEDTTREPLETLVFEEEGFAEAHRKGIEEEERLKKESQNATD